MSLEPKVGWLLGYSYLWAADHQRGDEDGIKSRPCALVAATRVGRDAERRDALRNLAGSGRLLCQTNFRMIVDINESGGNH